MNIAVIFAGGVGSRMNTKSRPKQFLELNGKPIIIYTTELFDNHPLIDSIIIVCIKAWIPFLEKMIRKFEINKVVAIIPGGETGQESIYNGLVAAEAYSYKKNITNPIVLIHDGVRPLITEDTITENIRTVQQHNSCITCIPAYETFIVKNKDNSSINIPPRSQSFIARAPQSFYLTDIIKSHRKALAEGKTDFIDSCSMMSYYGHQVSTIIGPIENIKITTPMDFFMFRAIVEVHENQQIFGI